MHSTDGMASAISASNEGRFGKILSALVRESGFSYGEPCFPFVASTLCRALGADYAIVGVLESAQRIRTLGFCHLNERLDNFEYDLAGTPSDQIVGHSVCAFPRGVADLFPNDPMLRQLGIQGYVGVPLVNSGGRPLGLIAALFTQPLDETAFAESILQLFSTRTASEIERLHMEANLQESSLRTRSLVEAMAEGMVLYDARGVAIDCNRAAERILRLTREQIVGLEEMDASRQHIHEDGRPWPMEQHPPQETLATGFPQRDRIMGILQSDKPETWISLNTEPIRLPDTARIAGCVATFRDISERRRAEKERRRLESELEHVQRLESLGSLAGGVAHDMNNILGAVMALATTLLARESKDDSLTQGLETIVRATERGRDLVKGLLEFARKEVEEPVLLDLNELVRKEADLLQRTTLQRISLEVRLGADLPLVLGDRQALASALMNLCVNAVDAMPRGGVLRLSTSVPSEGLVELSVTDTGEGMAPEVLSRALEPFFTTKPPGKGTGLGLSIVYGTVKAHGGLLDILSEVGVGTRVTVKLPAQASQPLVGDALLTPHVESNLKLQILLVDDDPLIRASVPSLLETLGHGVDVASSGEEALAKLWAGISPDAVILDLNMPGLGGAETLRHLRELEPELPVLVATGYLDNEARSLIGNYTGVAMLTKPFGLVELRKALAGMMPPVPEGLA